MIPPLLPAIGSASVKYRVRHKPTGKWLWHQRYDHGFSCGLVPDEHYPRLMPSEWQDRGGAIGALVSTTFGIRQMELVEMPNAELVGQPPKT